MGSGSSGFEEATGDVVGEVSEAEGDAAEVLEAAVESPTFVKPGVRPGRWR